jgi:DNA-binding transcriptional MocR family regulator
MTKFSEPAGVPDVRPPRKQAMVELLGPPCRCRLIEDDVYCELYFGLNRPHCPPKHMTGTGLVMHCSSFSKCLAPGYRVGWVAAGRFAGNRCNG